MFRALGDDDAGSLVAAVRRGETAAIARMLTLVERRSSSLPSLLASLQHDSDRAHVVGVTGPPGAGKSTLVNRLAAAYASGGRSIGVIAVDPSSAFSGGAILGDRIRMGEASVSDQVFIRSMATRGALGGLARATVDAVSVLDAAGKDVILIETVGVGQAEVDIVSAAHTVAVVSVPGLGDGVQMIKAGLLEIADVHVVNKGDRPGADRVLADIRELQHLAAARVGTWQAPVLRTVAQTGDGVDGLIAAFDDHLAWIKGEGEFDRKERRNASARIRWAAEDLVRSHLAETSADFRRAVDEVVARQDDPYSAAQRLLWSTARSSLSEDLEAVGWNAGRHQRT
jgi:LAO/AO transport system kinase